MHRRMSDQIRQFAIVNCRGIVERPTFGRFGFLCNRWFYGSIHLLLLWCCLCFAYLCNTALADFTASDHQALQNIDRHASEIFSILDNVLYPNLHEDNGKIIRGLSAIYSGGTFVDNGSRDNFITGGSDGLYSTSVRSGYSILQQLELMRRNLTSATNLLTKLQVTNDYSRAFSNMIHSIDLISTNFIPLNSSTELINKNLGNLANGYSLEDSDGNGFDNRISGIHYGNSSITMSDALQFIAQGVGGIDTSGNPHYQTQAMMPLINTILGWSGGFSNNNIQTNGIIGLLRQANSYLSEINSITNLVVEKIDEQINIISNGFAKVCLDLMPLLANNQTNLMYLESTMYPAFDTVQKYSTYLLTHDLEPRLNVANLSIPYYLPYYLCPEDSQGLYVDDYSSLYSNDYLPQVPNNIDLTSLRDWFHLNYGNMRTIEEATFGAGLDSETDSEVDEVKNHYTNESEDITFDLDSDLASVLQGPWAQPNQQLNSIKRNTSMDKSINDFKFLVRDALVEEEQSGGFGFSITFDGSENSNTIEFDRDTLFADSEFLARVKTTIDGYLDYITWIVKGGLILILGWRSAVTAMNVMGDGSI